jgi:L-ascorbate 6-phosphate lactonase
MPDVEITWLGQGGYAVRAPSGEVLLIDAYLSDYVEDELGNRRIVAPPTPLDEIEADVVVATHWHPDHQDPPTVRSIAARCPHAVFAGPTECTSRYAGWRIEPERIRTLDEGDAVQVGPFGLRGGFARHEVRGWLSEDAVSVFIEVAGVRILHSGDTEYDQRLRPLADAWGPFDVGLFVINGVGGCMNVYEAALLAHQMRPAVAVPMHYGMWSAEGYGPGATLDPGVFVEYCRRLGGPDTHVIEHGGTLRVPARA